MYSSCPSRIRSATLLESLGFFPALNFVTKSMQNVQLENRVIVQNVDESIDKSAIIGGPIIGGTFLIWRHFDS